MNSIRAGWVDNAKALGIITIVLGHAPGLASVARDFLYTFHVPLFFFLSGFLLKRTHLEKPYRLYLQRNVIGLLVPYGFFWAFSLLLWAAFQTVGGKKLWEDPGLVVSQFYGLLLGTGSALAAVNGVLWFYTCLFSVAAAFYWLAKPRAQWALPSGLLVVALLGAQVPVVLQQWRLLWNVDLAFAGILFYGAGYLARRDGWFDHLKSAPLMASLALGALVVTATVTLMNEKVDMSGQFFGHSYLLYVAGAFAGILMVTAFARLLPTSRVARYLSDNTIIIFSVHRPLFFGFWGVGVYVLGLPRDFDRHGSVYAVAYSASALLICIPLAAIIWRYFPWGLGARSHPQRVPPDYGVR